MYQKLLDQQWAQIGEAKQGEKKKIAAIMIHPVCVQLIQEFAVMSGDLKTDLASLFKVPKAPQARSLESSSSSSQIVTSSQSIKDLKDSYQRANQSLVLKVHRLEAELARSRKCIEELRTENASLKRKLYDVERLEGNERIEMLVEQRIKSKMDHLNHIGSRTISHLESAALNLRKSFEEFGVHINSTSNQANENVARTKRSSLFTDGQPRLNGVVESPPLVKEASVQKDENSLPQESETPRAKSARRKPRRSELFQTYRPEEITETPRISIDTTEAGSIEDTLEATPEASATPRERPYFETPAVPFSECDTVRRKRTATLKIKSFAEPRLNSKLRRPGRNDEPHPFVSSIY
ncbi:unnamed protein product [Cylicocyclus nassatus]|uniref:Shugoshin C-terminal domain-containing protein n=1 Tax=Cylicocyclus nassatus TaxID=53992 RepID=A0AA36GV79_CYLNA|nr:unnamed protein product [Cylicocyclus nassatus]